EAGGGIRAVALAEKEFEHRPRIDFDRQRRGRSAPGERVGVRAAVARVAAAREKRLLEADLERGELGVLAQMPGGDLIRRDAGSNVGALGFLRVDAGEPCRARARV